MADMTQIYDELQRLGITARYKGRNQAAMAIWLALEDEDRLECVVKDIYWVVADTIGCNRLDIERNIRTISSRAWNVSRGRLVTMARYPLACAPSASEFISIVTSHMKRIEGTAPV